MTFTKGLSAELAKKKIRVNVSCPHMSSGHNACWQADNRPCMSHPSLLTCAVSRSLHLGLCGRHSFHHPSRMRW